MEAILGEKVLNLCARTCAKFRSRGHRASILDATYGLLTINLHPQERGYFISRKIHAGNSYSGLFSKDTKCVILLGGESVAHFAYHYRSQPPYDLRVCVCPSSEPAFKQGSFISFYCFQFTINHGNGDLKILP